MTVPSRALSMTTNLAPVIFILGPTASGKTAAALALAERWPVEVVNADSRQVYRGMDIGTAKATREEQAKLPHHLLDLVNPDEPYSLALFLTHARQAIAEVMARGHLPLVVGGTGQYIWGLAEGWEVPAVPPQWEVRERLEEEAREKGGDELHRRLQRVDAVAAEAIDPRNVRRVVRALEVWEATGARFSAQRRRVTPEFTPYVFGLWVPREELYQRIDARVEAMLAAGWVGEVGRLMGAGYTPDLPSFSSGGYRELACYVQGSLKLEEAVRQTKVAVRRLARRQGAWFRQQDPRIRWGADMGLLAAAVGEWAGARL
jgi:tRNA dimethylallyltransferase